MFKKTLCAAMILAALAPAWAAEWMTDLEAAKTKAAAENKAVLVDFTGSDWCGWCIRLRKQVLDTPAFETYAKDKFVLMEVDVPQNPKFDQALLKRNQELCEQYGVSGFPTILVINPKGDVVGGFSGYVASTAEAAKPLDAALATAALLAKAETQQGAEQVATLAAAYKSLPEDLRENASALRQRIIALDTDDTSGMKRLQRVQEQRVALQQAINKAASAAEAIAIVDQALPTAEPENKAGMLQIKFQLMFMSAQTVDDIKASAEVMRQAIEADPNTRPGAMKRVDALLADPEGALKRLQSIRNQRKGAPKK
ncbi:MAG: thioredoxin family protein [Akkermansia sp.]|nr:thioredoxin family protein [Akkermansia sp.]